MFIGKQNLRLCRYSLLTEPRFLSAGFSSRSTTGGADHDGGQAAHPHLASAVCVHEAGYVWAASRFGIPLLPRRFDRGLRRYAGDLVDADADDAAGRRSGHHAP
jgi:hypothetical protein